MADTDNTESVTQLLDYASIGNPNIKFSLLDIPGVLPAGFMEHLRRLQTLSLTHQSAFIEQIASMGASEPIPFPKGLHSPAKGWNLQCIKSDSDRNGEFCIPAIDVDDTSSHENVINELKGRSILDDGQAEALFDSLARPFSLCQGPPGAGKSFFGVVWCQITLDSRESHDKKPVVVVCQTNHALDDFLKSLLKKGIKNVVRLGNRSTEEWTSQYMLKNIRHKTKLSGKQGRERSLASAHIENIVKQASNLAESLSSQTVCWVLVEDYLKEHRPCIYNHFTTLQRVEVDIVDLRRSRTWTGFAFSYWFDGNDLKDTQRLLERVDSLLGNCDLKDDTQGALEAFKTKILKAAQKNVKSASSEVDNNSDILWYLSVERRQGLVQEWLKTTSPRAMAEKLGELHRRFRIAKRRFNLICDHKDASIISSQQTEVIAVTSTGCARNWGLLKSIAPHTMIFEEASELLEAHSLVAMVPSVKHVISIGDPLQLRPHVTQMSLSTDHSILYGLDISLFERAISQKTPLPYTQLKTQRRAHPDMADLLRAGAYPYLVDHDSTAKHPQVRGFPKRMYWMQHDLLEDARDPRSAFASSYTNTHEVDWVEALVKYLIRTQGYTAGKITVITPYNGQLAALHTRLAQSYDLALTPADKEHLIEKNLLNVDESTSDSDTTSVELGNMITVATVDNYQGEENDIVIFSPVRSNTKGKLGFLKIQNRVNVAISRARHGFYVVGNSDMIKAGSKQWADIIDVFERKNAIGQTITVFPCSQHDDVTVEISKPSDFDNVPPCTRPCGEKLSCGHECMSSCHPTDMHADGRKLCTGTHNYIPDCGHPMKVVCGEIPGECCHIKGETTLPCGHKFTELCSTVKEAIKCRQVDRSIQLECGHVMEILCEDRAKMIELECHESCGKALDCGHLCTGECSTCDTDKVHPSCAQICQKQLSCGHKCDSVCHDGSCPPCKQTCLNSCKHKQCNHRCGEACQPCTERVQSRVCAHRTETEQFCCLPSTSLPCSEPCKRLLSCKKHVCSGLCGEKCPPECPECTAGDRILGPTITLGCNHTFSVVDIDERFRIGSLYQTGSNSKILQGKLLPDFDPGRMICPRCNAPSPRTSRYELGYAVSELRSTVDLLYLKFGAEILHLQYAIIGAYHTTEVEHIIKALRTGPIAARHNEFLIRTTSDGLASAQEKIVSFRDDVVVPMQKAIQEVTTLLHNTDMFPVPVHQYKLRFDLEVLQCRWLKAINAMKMVKEMRSLPGCRDRANRVLTEGVEFAIIKQVYGDLLTIEPLILEAQKANLRRLEAEFVIAQINLGLILREVGHKGGMDIQSKLRRVSELVSAFPGSAGRLSEVVKALKMYEAKGGVLVSLGYEMPKATTMWHRYGKHRLGSLTHCKNGHPYSTETFSRGCPECS